VSLAEHGWRVAGVVAVLGCRGPRAHEASHAAPATVAHRVVESSLTTVTLTPQAVSRLGIETARAARQRVPRSRELGAELVAPPGQSALLTAPVAGIVRSVQGAPEAGRLGASRRSALMRLVPLAPTDRDLRAQATQTVSAALARLDAAEARARRAQQLAQDRAGSVRASEEAAADRDVARAAVVAARARSARLASAPLESDVALTIRATAEGVMRQVFVSDGQAVAAGAPLGEVVASDPLWLRVPVFVGDLGEIDARVAAAMRLRVDERTRVAAPVRGPLTADPTAATTDLFYAVENRDGALRPGMRALLTVPLRAEEDAVTIPVSAMVYDLEGGVWVYAVTREGTYARRRVALARTVGDLAVLSRGLAGGEEVVTVGAAELYGTEFGAGH
jgi:cobalt-zinc-cadmium efflux system membrane fusion protein